MNAVRTAGSGRREVTRWAGEFAPRRSSVSEARRTTRRLLPLIGFAGDHDAAVLIVSELVTNAVNQPQGEGTTLLMRLSVSEGALTIGVCDHSPAEPRPSSAPMDAKAESGRGLLLVTALGATVTWETRGGGFKEVCALLPAPSEGTE
ncbi:ATP-binding protein [Streptomyces sp. NPDC058372]|uniref:ATP-binding protein n=1 Tax=Streptomyces sp. NPDC058372 TaxID=3346464 RepID=UPI003646A7FF